MKIIHYSGTDEDTKQILKFTAEGTRWEVRFSKSMKVKHKWLLGFMLWFMPKLGIRARVTAKEYTGVRFNNHPVNSNCRLGFGAHRECCGEDK